MNIKLLKIIKNQKEITKLLNELINNDNKKRKNKTVDYGDDDDPESD